jgi:lipoprotein NlpI
VKVFIKIASFSLVLLTQACTSLPSSGIKSTAMEQLIIAEPLAISYKSEIAIARLTEIIQRAKITDSQRAELLYDRGVRYDNVGLNSLARIDFNRALRLKPDLVDAYNLLGIHLTQSQDFTQAYDAFDSVLDIKPEHEYAYFNRGIALYYGGRPALAMNDFIDFHQQRSSDPYRLLWLYFAQMEVDQAQAQIMLKAGEETIADNVWAKRIIKLYLDEISLAQFTQELTYGLNSQQALTERLCEAYFYLGKLSLLRGQKGVAANYFKLALGTNVYEFVEHRYARLELDLLKEKP